MKISEDRLFPYPVLRKGNENFKSAKFEVEQKVRNNEMEYEFQLNVSIDVKNLVELLKKKEVSIICHLECVRTKFRSVVELNIGKNEFKINGEFLDGRLELITFFIAKKDLKDYNSKDFDSDYENNSFFIKKGSILGIVDMPSVIIENKKENYSNLPSIFQICRNDYERVMKIRLNEERIIIDVPLGEFRIRDAYKENLHVNNIIKTMIVLPALVAVLNDLSHKDSKETHGGKRWYRVIRKKLQELNYDIERGDLEDNRIFSISQELLEELFPEGMESLKFLGKDAE
jgi:hypothetical protein